MLKKDVEILRSPPKGKVAVKEQNGAPKKKCMAKN